MNHLNEVRLIGNLGEAPEIKSCSNGATLFKMRLATGEEWHSVEYFCDKPNATAFLSERLAKGMMVFISGEIATDKYKDKAGKPRIWKKIKAYRLMILRESLRDASTFEADIPEENPDVPQYHTSQQHPNHQYEDRPPPSRPAPPPVPSVPKDSFTGFDRH